MVSNFGVAIYTSEDLLVAFEHYKRAFGATLLFTAEGPQGEIIHLEMDTLGNKLALAPASPEQLRAGNVTVLCLQFPSKQALRRAYRILEEEGGQGEGLSPHPWNPLEGFVTDKYGVKWRVGIYNGTLDYI